MALHARVERPVPHPAARVDDGVSRADAALRRGEGVRLGDLRIVGDRNLSVDAWRLAVGADDDKSRPPFLEAQLLDERGGLVEVKQVKLLQGVNGVMKLMVVAGQQQQ